MLRWLKKAESKHKDTGAATYDKGVLLLRMGVANMGAGHGIQVAKAVGAKYVSFSFIFVIPFLVTIPGCSHLQWRLGN